MHFWSREFTGKRFPHWCFLDYVLKNIKDTQSAEEPQDNFKGSRENFLWQNSILWQASSTGIWDQARDYFKDPRISSKCYKKDEQLHLVTLLQMSNQANVFMAVPGTTQARDICSGGPRRLGESSAPRYWFSTFLFILLLILQFFSRSISSVPICFVCEDLTLSLFFWFLSK